MLKSAALLATAIVAAAWLANSALAPTFRVHMRGGIVVTGASTGIGRAVAEALAAHGYTVFAGVRQERDALSIKAAGIALLQPLLLDVTDPASVATAAALVAQWAATTNNSLVGLVNNAGVSWEFPLEATPIDKYKSVHEVNVVGTLRATQAFLPMLRAAEGRIVNIGSVAGLVGVPLFGAYSATKFALEALTDVLRRELQQFGVAVSMVNPGCVVTAMQPKMEAAVGDLEAELGAELWLLYGNFTRASLRAREDSFLSASPVTVTTEAIIHALTAAAPHTRYVVATAGGHPAIVYVVLAWLLPARWMDALLASGVAQFGHEKI